MSDLISRQAAIAEIMEDIKDRSLHDDPGTPEDYAEGYDEGIRNAAVIVLQMPSAQSGWIPVTERLPEEDGQYLTTCKSFLAGYDYTDIFSFKSDIYDEYEPYRQEHKPGWLSYSDETGWFEMSNVTAWMPLPKPWEGGQDGQ